MVFYLKVNKSDSYMLSNIEKWISTITDFFSTPQIFIICDKEDLVEKISHLSIVIQNQHITFINSLRNNTIINKIAKHASSSLQWFNAACAHLTPLFHAFQNNFDNFWNIDADDTLFLCSPQKQAEILKNAQSIAILKKIDGFSLDFWWTRTSRNHWTFGITFIQNVKEHINILSKWCPSFELNNWIEDVWSVYYNKINVLINLDVIYTFFKRKNILNLETFYVENLCFIHYHSDMLKYPYESGLYKWSKGILFLPLFYFLFGNRSESIFFIPHDTIKIDVGLDRNEGQFFLRKSSSRVVPNYEIVSWEDLVENEEIELKRKIKELHIDILKDTYLFGCGQYCRAHFLTIRKTFTNIKGFIDNNKALAGRIVYNGLICNLPKELFLANIDINIIICSGIEQGIEEMYLQMTRLGYKNVFKLKELIK